MSSEAEKPHPGDVLLAEKHNLNVMLKHLGDCVEQLSLSVNVAAKANLEIMRRGLESQVAHVLQLRRATVTALHVVELKLNDLGMCEARLFKPAPESLAGSLFDQRNHAE